MTGNKSYLSDYEEIDGGFIAFGGNPKGGKITGKGKIKTGKLDFEYVYIVKELKFNLFSVSQMRDKKNRVLFTDTECVVLSPDFKLLDESQVLLRVPRKNNMYIVDLKNVVPSGGNQTNDNTLDLPISSSPKRSDDEVADDAGKKSTKDPTNEGDKDDQDLRDEFEREFESSPINTAGTKDADDELMMPNLEDTGIFGDAYDDDRNFMDVKECISVWQDSKRKFYVWSNSRILGFEDPEFPDRVYKVKGDILLVQVYVDDIIFGSTKKSLCTEFEKLMHKKFQMSSMGELTFFLGLQVTQKDDGIFISQDKYVDEILKKFGFSTLRTTSTPMETSKPLMKDENAEDVDVHLYRSMIGSLMYLTSSRPDIMFVVCACARFQVTPKVSHLHAVKRIFRYLKGQPKLGLWYPKDSPFDLEAYIDSDYAGASLDRKSTTGGCQFLRSILISWQCKKQTIVANSTTEAEYVAASNCCGQVL
ncbi:putative ribonuclease H-like domain-containing protein [Tanacetum coccineum]